MEFVSDEQRKAVFANIKSGGYGGRSRHRDRVPVRAYKRTPSQPKSSQLEKQNKERTNLIIKKAALWAVKSIAQAAVPPAAPAIEVGYKVYNHGPTISKITSYVKEGNMEEVKKLVAKETASELAAVGIAEIASYSCEKVFENLDVNEKVKEYYTNFLEGALDAINE